MREGGCLCGAVRYRVAGQPLASGICHCETCRRAASAPTLPFATFSMSAFAFTRGEPLQYRSSPHVIRTFCGRCGSPLTYRNEQHAAALDIMLCSLDDPDNLRPTFSVWVSQKLDWDEPAAGLPGHDRERAATAE